MTSRLLPIAPKRVIPFRALSTPDRGWTKEDFFSLSPWPHQVDAMEKGARQREFALFWEVGIGKSAAFLANAAFLWLAQKVDRVLIVSPSGVHRQWVEEQVRDNLVAWVPRTSFIYRSGLSAKKLERMEQDFSRPDAGLLILSMHAEALSTETGYQIAQRFVSGGPTLFGVDESHMFKTPSATRTRRAQLIGQKAAFVRLMTATESAEGYEDLYAQFRVMNPRIIGSQTFTGFKAEFCVMGGYEMREVKGYQNLPVLMNRIAPYIHSAVRTRAIPPMDIYRDVELSAEQERAYKELAKECLTEIDNGYLSAAMAATRMQRLQQILCGFARVTDDQGENARIVRLPSPRVEATFDLVRGIRGKFLIFAQYHEDVQRLTEELVSAGVLKREEFGLYYGGQEEEQNQADKNRFKQDPSCRGLILTPKKGGPGLNLGEAQTAIYYSYSGALIDWIQSRGRIDRGMAEAELTYFILRAPGTLDAKILSMLAKKEDIASVIKDPRKFGEILRQVA